MSDTGSRHPNGGDGRHRAPATSDALQSAMRALHDELQGAVIGPAMDILLDDVLTRVATQARHDGLSPERLLVAFRQLWDADNRPIMPRKLPGARDQVRWRLVSALVMRYYMDTDGAASDLMDA